MIKGLTDREARFPRIGILRKGGPKQADGNMGQDLPYFRFVSGDPEILKKFHDIYGTEPKDINISLPYQTVEENFHCWREERIAGGLVHRCNGERTVMYMDKTTRQYVTDPQKQIKCPGNCAPVGRLQVIIPELKRFAFVEVITSSIWDIIAIQESLLSAFQVRHDLRGMPFILKRGPRKISTPRKDGRRVMMEKSLLSIEIGPVWAEKHLSELERLALPGAQEPIVVEKEDEPSFAPGGSSEGGSDEIPMDYEGWERPEGGNETELIDTDKHEQTQTAKAGGQPAPAQNYSIDDEENEKALRLHELVIEIVTKSGDPYEQVMKSMTARPGQAETGKLDKPGVKSIHEFFQFKHINEAYHIVGMKRLDEAIGLAEEIVNGTRL